MAFTAAEGTNYQRNKVVLEDEDGNDINSSNRLPVDAQLVVGDIEIGAVELKNSDTDDRASIDTNGNLAIRNFSTLVPEEYDYIDLTYTGDDLTTVTYKTGGSGGTTVATLTLTYTASVLQTVTRT
jgi:hypothetical protein